MLGQCRQTPGVGHLSPQFHSPWPAIRSFHIFLTLIPLKRTTFALAPSLPWTLVWQNRSSRRTWPPHWAFAIFALKWPTLVIFQHISVTKWKEDWSGTICGWQRTQWIDFYCLMCSFTQRPFFLRSFFWILLSDKGMFWQIKSPALS